MKSTGYAIIGAGVIARTHAEAITRCPRAHIETIVADNEVQARELAERFQTAFDTSLDAALARRAVEVVDICTPSFLHGSMAVAALTAGRHVLVEKPMDISLASADAMISAAGQAGKTLGVVFQNRMSDAVTGVKAAITAGKLGRLTACAARVNGFRSTRYYAESGWRGTWAKDGGGAAINQGIHYVDLLIHLVGDIDSVTATADALGHDIEVEDTIAALVRFKNGAIGTFQASTAAFPGLPPSIAISGTKGSVIIQNGAVRFRYFAEDHGASVGDYGLEGEAFAPFLHPDAFPGPHGHDRVIADFTEAVQRGRAPFVSGMEGRKSLAAVDAMYRSIRAAGTINL